MGGDGAYHERFWLERIVFNKEVVVANDTAGEDLVVLQTAMQFNGLDSMGRLFFGIPTKHIEADTTALARGPSRSATTQLWYVL